MRHFFRFRLFFRFHLLAALCLVFLLQAPALALDVNPAGQAFVDLHRGMLAYEKGDNSLIDSVFARIEPPKNVSASQKDTYLLRTAKKLNLIIQNIDFDPVRDIPEPGDKDQLVVRLGARDGYNFIFRMEKASNGKWCFSTGKEEDVMLDEMYRKIKNHLDKMTRADMEGDTFVSELSSPYRTTLTLRSGVRGFGGYTLEDAVQTLDLEPLSPAVRDTLGEIWAVQLYRILAYRSPLNFEQLSADPATDNFPVFLVRPGVGIITMNVYTDAEGTKSWKFTFKSMEVVSAVYDDFMTNGMAKEIQYSNYDYWAGDVPLHVMVDDLVQMNFPSLEQKVWGINGWKYVCMAVALLLIPLLCFVVGLILRRLARMMPNLKRDDGGSPVLSLILPARIAIVSALVLNTLLVVTTSSFLLQSGVFVLDLLSIITLTWMGCLVVEIGFGFFVDRTRNRTQDTMLQVVAQVVKILVLVVGLVAVATLFGHNSRNILAALGIGGLALALAGKDTVENIFGTVMIVATRPFTVGDYVVVEGYSGTIESVGIRSTEIRTLDDSLVTIPNARFISQPLDNRGKRSFRRYQTTFGVQYDTPPRLIQAFVEGLRELIYEHPLTRKNRFNVYIYELGDSSIDIWIDMYFGTNNRSKELESREKFIMDAILLAERLGVSFAFPSRTIYNIADNKPEYRDFQDSDTAGKEGRKIAREVMGLPPDSDEKMEM